MYCLNLETGLAKGYTELELWQELQPLLIVHISESRRKNAFSQFCYWIKDLKINYKPKAFQKNSNNLLSKKHNYFHALNKLNNTSTAKTKNENITYLKLN
jgi:hypothetical protein